MPQHKLRFLLRPVASASRRSNARKTAFELRPTAQRVEAYRAYMGKASCSSPIPQGVIRTASFSLRGGPNFLVLVVHRVVPAKLATRKSDGFVLIGKRSHRLAARAHDPSCSRQ